MPPGESLMPITDARARYLRPATTSRKHSSGFIITYSVKLSNTSVTHLTVATLTSRELAVDRQVRAVRLQDSACCLRFRRRAKAVLRAPKLAQRISIAAFTYKIHCGTRSQAYPSSELLRANLTTSSHRLAAGVREDTSKDAANSGTSAPSNTSNACCKQLSFPTSLCSIADRSQHGDHSDQSK